MIKKLTERFFAGFAAWYRFRRDRQLFAAQRMRPTALGFEFIGVAGMPESRTASGEVAMLRELLRGRDLFVDVGANCGLYTLIACHADVPVLAIEPNDLNFRRLQENLVHNRYAKAEALNVALGEVKVNACFTAAAKAPACSRIGAGWLVLMPAKWTWRRWIG